MTCDEVRLYVTSRPAGTCTRAERAAVYHHMLGCESCHEFCRAESEKATPDQYRQSARVSEELHRRDIQDPEFVRTVYGD